MLDPVVCPSNVSDVYFSYKRNQKLCISVYSLIDDQDQECDICSVFGLNRDVSSAMTLRICPLYEQFNLNSESAVSGACPAVYRWTMVMMMTIDACKPVSTIWKTYQLYWIRKQKLGRIRVHRNILYPIAFRKPSLLVSAIVISSQFFFIYILRILAFGKYNVVSLFTRLFYNICL